MMVFWRIDSSGGKAVSLSVRSSGTPPESGTPKIVSAKLPTSQSNLERLEAAFQFFNDTSSQLAQSYELLEKRVSSLTQELDEVSEAKQRAHKNEEKLAGRMQALLDFMPGGVIVLDHQGYIVESNPAARALLDDKLDGELWRHVISKCFAPRNDDGLEVSTKTGKRISIATSSMDNHGQIILLTDQTETRELQRNLSRHERLSSMGKMVSALAHQIRTPLSAAILYAGHLTNGSIAQAKKDTFAKKLLGRLQHMERTVRDMMLFVKSELPLNDVISLADLEVGLREASEVPILTSAAKITWRNTHPSTQIRCHREALISAIMNLINNAIQASDKPITILVNLSGSPENLEPKRVCINVVDNGPGLDKSVLDSAMELFVTTKAHGTGLGLAVVQSVARAHGGTFSIMSPPECGTKATLILPEHCATPSDVADITKQQCGVSHD
ncbi:sensor histidine kinase [Saccharophagus degradans]|uniref:histidine kinase n=1 Tax=Saccharophagus degradans (strain 2-40 / ATCC 43961 / DSM 17024) TaxID=203122 RepID=Q21IM7_SACD2|nr:ATP-binding protein [Saccharophagus degradans]ABD81452.1 PAS/PAC sensor signal transduction histidine kinase [Saccharophagus degradans 2-40]